MQPCVEKWDKKGDIYAPTWAGYFLSCMLQSVQHRPISHPKMSVLKRFLKPFQGICMLKLLKYIESIFYLFKEQMWVTCCWSYLCLKLEQAWIQEARAMVVGFILITCPYFPQWRSRLVVESGCTWDMISCCLYRFSNLCISQLKFFLCIIVNNLGMLFDFWLEICAAYLLFRRHFFATFLLHSM